MKLLVSVDRVTGLRRVINDRNTPLDFSALYAKSVAGCYKDSDIKIYVLDLDKIMMDDPLPEDKINEKGWI